MVFVADKVRTWPIPVDKVFEFIALHVSEVKKMHPRHKGVSWEKVDDNHIVIRRESEVQGKTVESVNKLTMFRPIGITVEFQEGPMAGTTIVNYFEPKGNKTRVVAVGDWKSSSIPDEKQLHKVAQTFLEEDAEEDLAYLKTLKW